MVLSTDSTVRTRPVPSLFIFDEIFLFLDVFFKLPIFKLYCIVEIRIQLFFRFFFSPLIRVQKECGADTRFMTAAEVGKLFPWIVTG
jgi:hypothetical protein